MDELFGLKMTDLMAGVLVILGLIVATVAVLAFRHPLLFKLGIRNVPRRRAQTTLIVLGLMLSTIIISAAFTTGDTLSNSLRGTALQIAGRIDHLITYDVDAGRSASSTDAVVPEEAAAQIKQDFADDPQIQGFTRALFDSVAMFNRENRQILPNAFLLGLAPEEVERIDGIPAVDGDRLDLSVLGERGIILNRSAANELAADVGDTVAVRARGEDREFRVVALAEDTIVSGEVNPQEPQGAVIRLEDAQEILDFPGVVTGVGVTVRGGVQGALDSSAAVDERLNDYLDAQAAEEVTAGVPPGERIWSDASGRPLFSSEPFKQDALDDAELFGSIFTTLFLLMGLFSIGAGVLLIFLIFVMLSEERKPEMGIARAVGMRRGHLVESYIAEGLAYDFGSAIVGAVIGIFVAFGMVGLLNSSLGEEFGFEFERHVEARSLVVAIGLGIIVTFITITISAFRVSVLNIVAAIRDVPETRTVDARGFRSWRTAAGAVTTALGLALLPLNVLTALVGTVLLAVPFLGGFIRRRGWGEYVVVPLWKLMRWRPEWWFAVLLFGVLFMNNGIGSESAFMYLLGVSLLPLGALLLARRVGRPGRVAHSVVGLVLLLLWLSPGSWHEDLFGTQLNGDVELFFLSGAMMVTGGTVLVIFNFDLLAAGLKSIGGIFGRMRPVVQTAAAYPSTSRFRTGMTIAMIAIIMFALSMFTTINENFSRLFTSDTATGGYDIQATTNRNAPIADLAAGLRDAGHPDLAARLNNVSTLSVGSAATDVVTLSQQAWDPLDEVPIRDASGQIVVEQPELELLEEAEEAGASVPEHPADNPSVVRFQQVVVEGANEAFIETNEAPLQARALGFESDEEVWEALQQPGPNGERYAVANALSVGAAGGPFGDAGDDAFSLPDSIDEDTSTMPLVRVFLRNAGEDLGAEVVIVGVINQVVSVTETPNFSPALVVSEETLRGIYPTNDFTRHLATVAPEFDALETAQAIETALAVETVSIVDELEQQQELATAILRLFQGFTALGLLAGLAALGVIAVRAVVERRQQIGMLRAIGFRQRMVGTGLLLEMGLIAAVGLLLGAGLAILLSWRLFDEGVFGSTAGAGFYVPIGQIVIFTVVALLATLVLTYLPARQASRTTIAEALRYE